MSGHNRLIIRLGHVRPDTDTGSEEFQDFVHRRASMSNISLENRVVKVSPSGEVEVYGRDVVDVEVRDDRV